MVLTHGFDMISKNYKEDDDNEYSRKYLSLLKKSLTIDNVIRLTQTIDLVGNVKCLGIGLQSKRINCNVHNKLINFYKENLQKVCIHKS
jgi:hypothetical protein